MGVTTYNLISHQSAQNELATLPNDEQETLTAILKDISTYERPTNHPKARPLRHTDNFFRVRSGDYRAICLLELPYLIVLKVTERDDDTYTKGLNEAKERKEADL